MIKLPVANDCIYGGDDTVNTLVDSCGKQLSFDDIAEAARMVNTHAALVEALEWYVKRDDPHYRVSAKWAWSEGYRNAVEALAAAKAGE